LGSNGASLPVGVGVSSNPGRSGDAGSDALKLNNLQNWLESGGSLQALQEILGHGSIRMTQRYARLSDEHVLLEARRVWSDQELSVAGVVASSL